MKPIALLKSINTFVVISPALSPENGVNPAIATIEPGFGDLPDTKA